MDDIEAKVNDMFQHHQDHPGWYKLKDLKPVKLDVILYRDLFGDGPDFPVIAQYCDREDEWIVCIHFKDSFQWISFDVRPSDLWKYADCPDEVE